MVHEEVATGLALLILGWATVRIWVTSLAVLWVDGQESGEA